MQCIISVVGRPNVGKSTLFNFLTGSRDALVIDQAGITRDRQYGFGSYQGHKFILVDTGGMNQNKKDKKDEEDIPDLVHVQSLQAIEESNALIWLVDGRDGMTVEDQYLAKILRSMCQHIFLSVNKTEGLDTDIVLSEFHGHGFIGPYAISAKRGQGITHLLDEIFQQIPIKSDATVPLDESLQIALLGRPNVGKSTLTNRVLGEQRMITSAQPGTTRNSIATPFKRHGIAYTLVDTAGIRRRSKVKDMVEKFSVMQSLQAMSDAKIIILMLDAQDIITEQDATLLGLIATSGKGLLIVVNKWDGLDISERKKIKTQLDRKLGFIDYASIHFISALYGRGINGLFVSIKEISKSIAIEPKTSEITTILQNAVLGHSPPLVQGRRIRLRYAHIGGHNPIRIVVHGNQVDKLPVSYKRYLARQMREQLKLVGTPVLIDFKKNANPYKETM